VAEPAQPDQRGRRGPVLIGGLGAFVALFVLTAVFGTRTIERDLTRDTERALSAALPASSYDVSFDGRDARLVANSVADLENVDAARRVVLDVHGVRSVDVDEEAPEPEATIRATAERRDGRVALTGTVLSDAERQALVAAAEAAVGASAVDDRLRVESAGVATAADDGALTRLADVVAAFGGVTEARATLEGTVLTVSGTASTDTGADAVNAAVAAAAAAGLVTDGTVTGPGGGGGSSQTTGARGSGDTSSGSAATGPGATGATGSAASGPGGGRTAGGASTTEPAATGGSGGSIGTVVDTGAPGGGAAAGGIEVQAVRDDSGIRLSGQVLSAEHKSALLNAASQAVGAGSVVDQLTVAADVAATATDDERVVRLAAVVATFGGLVQGDAALSDASLTVSGLAVDEDAADAVNGSVDAAQAAGLSVSSVVITEPEGDASATTPPPPRVPATAGPVVTIPTSTASAGSIVPGGAAPGGAEALAAPLVRSTASSATAIGS
jgi:hypothetical protein